MKVNIGKHTNWVGPYQVASFLCGWAKKVPDEYGIMCEPDWIHSFGEFLAHGFSPKNPEDEDVFGPDRREKTWFYKLLLWIDGKKKRRFDVRIDYWDTWNFDSTLAPIILPMLKQLKETKHGAPGNMPAFSNESNQAQRCFDFYKEDDDMAWDTGHKQWEEILDKMIWSFEEIQKDWESQYHSGTTDWRTVPVDREGNTVPKEEAKSFLMVNGPKHTAKFDSVGYNAHAERIQEGFELFGKYFTNLWD